jgi:DNA-binding transcriptional LysR family regulator
LTFDFFPMELRHLRSFLAVAETLNFSRAAERLHLSQPALSRQVQELESDLGVALFSRAKGRVSLSDAGRALVEHARELLARSDNAATHVQAVARGECATVEIGYAPSLAVQLLPLVLERLAQSHPSMNLRMHDLSSDEMNDGLRSGALELAYTAGASVLAEPGLVKETLVSYPVCVAVSRTHPWARRKQVSLADLATAPLLGYARSAYPEYPVWVESLFGSAKARPKIAAEFDSVSSLLLRIEAGSGVALVPWSFSCHGTERMVLLPIKPAPPPLDLVMCWRRGQDSAAIRAVREVSSACGMELRTRAKGERVRD